MLRFLPIQKAGLNLPISVRKFTKNTLKLCQYAGCPRLVIHGISRPAGDNSMTEKQFFELNMHMYSALIPTIKETKVMVLLENLFTSFGGRYVYAGTCPTRTRL